MIHLRQLHSLLTTRSENRQQAGDPEQILHALAQIDQLQLATGTHRRDEQSYDGAESHAIHLSEVGQIEHDPLTSRYQLLHFNRERIGHARDQLAAAFDDRAFAVSVNLETESRRVRHLRYLT